MECQIDERKARIVASTLFHIGQNTSQLAPVIRWLVGTVLVDR